MGYLPLSDHAKKKSLYYLGAKTTRNIYSYTYIYLCIFIFYDPFFFSFCHFDLSDPPVTMVVVDVEEEETTGERLGDEDEDDNGDNDDDVEKRRTLMKITTQRAMT